jgi:hypothetical protein
MPPRFAYWTIIIDDAPTAFRARYREDLVPTLRQLARRNPNATIKWFSQGKLWESPEEARAARQMPPSALPFKQTPPRGPDWRPGGRHEDPRARFKKRGRAERGEADRRMGGPASEKPGGARAIRSSKPDPRARFRKRGDKAGKSGHAGGASPAREPWKKDRDQRRAKQRERRHGRNREPEPTRRPGTTGEPAPEPPPPERPPGPDRPPKPGQEPPPHVPDEETIRILPEPPERAKR